MFCFRQMDGGLVLPRLVTDKLKCDLCNGYLSVGPISSNEEKFACGRCNPGWPHNTIYEQLAQFMLFPCSYCDEQLAWSSMEKHESRCRQNVILCPFKYKKNFHLSKMPQSSMGEYHKQCQSRKLNCPFDFCEASYEVKNISTHFAKFHKDYIFSNVVQAKKILKEEKVWNFNPDTQVCLINYKLMPFLLFIHSVCTYEESTGDIISYDYFFSIFSLCLEKCSFNYNVTIMLSSEEGTAKVSLDNQEIKPFNEKLHCIKYLRIGLVKFNSFNFMTTRFEKIRKYEVLKLTYKIEIFDHYGVKVDNNKKNFFVNIDLGKNFECPICKEYLISPIYNCNTGHSFCKKCKEQLITCPFCQAVIGNSRNFVLEDILEVLQICCPNEPKGCQFLGKVQEVKLHELMCLFN